MRWCVGLCVAVLVVAGRISSRRFTTYNACLKCSKLKLRRGNVGMLGESRQGLIMEGVEWSRAVLTPPFLPGTRGTDLLAPVNVVDALTEWNELRGRASQRQETTSIVRERVPWLNRWDADLVLKKVTSLPECRVKSLQSRWSLASA